jgi:hypothetical protein
MSFSLRNRAAFFLFLLSAFFSGTYFLFMSRAQRSTIHTLIVEETKTQFDNLKRNFDDDEVRRLVLEEPFLDEFALDSRGARPKYYDDAGAGKEQEPALVVTAVNRGGAGQAVHFVRNVFLFLPNATVRIYDLGLSYYETELVTKYCNSTACAIMKFDADPYPGHVDRLAMSASRYTFLVFYLQSFRAGNKYIYLHVRFRPLIIKKCLQNHSSLLWLDVSQRLTSKDLAPFLIRARESGILAWFRDVDRPLLPTSAMTHPNMFTRLGVTNPSELEEFHFQHMVGLDALVVYNTKEISDAVLALWVKCSLLPDCVEPVGSQSTGCRMDKKPQFRYSGCHDYDVSALNVLLGRHFKFAERKYVSEQRFFTTMSEDLETDLLDNVGKNSTVAEDEEEAENEEDVEAKFRKREDRRNLL